MSNFRHIGRHLVSRSPNVKYADITEFLDLKNHKNDTNIRSLAVIELEIQPFEYQISDILAAILFPDRPLLNLTTLLDFLTSKIIKLTPILGLQLSYNSRYYHLNGYSSSMRKDISNRSEQICLKTGVTKCKYAWISLSSYYQKQDVFADASKWSYQDYSKGSVKVTHTKEFEA